MGQDGNILRYEFPILPWVIAQLQRVFGESIVVTRVVLFVIGLFGLLGFYWLASLIFKDRLIAALSTWTMSLSPLYYYYTMNPLSDVLAMSAQILMMACAIKYLYTHQFKYFIYAALMLCLAGLSKLPYFIFGIMPFSIALIVYFKNGRSNRTLIKSIVWLVISSLPVATWYIYAISSWQSMGVLKGVFGGTSVEDLLRFFTFHLFSWLPLHLINPISLIFFVIGLIAVFNIKVKESVLWWVIGSGIFMLLVYYIYELNMISTVHDYYLLPFMVFIHLFIGLGIFMIWKLQDLRFLLIGMLLIMPVAIYPRINEYYWSIDRNGYKTDWFTYSEDLKKVVPRDSLCIMVNDNTAVVVPYQIDKQGYVFDKDDLPVMWIEDMILHRRASYMYSDSRKIDTSHVVLPYLDSLILTRGEINVFKLKNAQEINALKNK